MKRNPERHEPLRLFDELARIHKLEINDPASAERFASLLRDAVQIVDPIQFHGARTQAMFGYVAASLGQCRSVKEEDVGRSFSADKGSALPDYRLVTNDGTELLVEVKNCHADPTAGSFRISPSKVAELQRYASIARVGLRFAVYWSRIGQWTLFAPQHLKADRKSGKLFVSFLDAFAHSEMETLGDKAIATSPPITMDIPLAQGVDRPVDYARISLAATEMEDHDRQVALYFALFGRWRTSEPSRVVGEGCEYLRYTFTPRDEDGVWSFHNKSQPFRTVGTLSEMIARHYLFETSTVDGRPLRISPTDGELDSLKPPNIEPGVGRIPLWVFKLLPRVHSQ